MLQTVAGFFHELCKNTGTPAAKKEGIFVLSDFQATEAALLISLKIPNHFIQFVPLAYTL